MMNMELLESLCKKYPEEPDGVLDFVSEAVTVQFNKLGTLLAVGCNDGRLVIWDFMTRGIAKVITAHSHPVCSVSWSRNGHKILTGSTDNTVNIFDVTSGDCENKLRFPSPVLKVQFHPRNPQNLLVCPLRHADLVVFVDGTQKTVPVEDDNDLNIVASFDRRGEYIYTGNSKGRVSAYTITPTGIVPRASFQIGQGVTTSKAVKSIDFARRGECFLVNSADKIIRVYNCRDVLEAGIDGNPEPVQKLQDKVNKNKWKKCCFSGDGKYICAGYSRQNELFIWDTTLGSLVTILRGPKEKNLMDVVWHPMRPIVAVISSGTVSIWSSKPVQNMCAFAPDFKEVENVEEYEERESEFDLEDEDKITEENPVVEDDDFEVDVTTVDQNSAYVSSDEEGQDADFLMFIPAAPDIIQDFDEHALLAQPIKQQEMKIACDIKLENAPVGESHPLMNNKSTKDKPGGSNHSKTMSSSGGKKEEEGSLLH